MSSFPNNPASNIWKPFTISGVNPDPLFVKSGNGIYLELEDGRLIKDMISSWWVNLHGHTHPAIAKAIADQAQQLEHVIFADFTHEPAEKLAENLLRVSDKVFDKVFFSDNGSTAVEVALKIALQYRVNQGETKRSKILAFDGAYHGDTLGAMSTGARSIFNEAFNEWMFNVERVAFPQTWIGDEHQESKETATLTQIRKLLEQEDHQIAALIIEPLIQGAGGMRMCSESFIHKLVELVRSFGVIVIFDEVMTGFGRTGSLFAYQKTGVVPDLICLSKGITGGFVPLAVTMVQKHIFDAFDKPDAKKTFWHGHSYTANPLGCAAALASLTLTENNSSAFKTMESWHVDGLSDLVSTGLTHKERICGTIMAVDVRMETATSTGYLSEVGPIIKKKALEHGILIRPLGNVLYLMPPYCITKDELLSVYQELTKILTELKIK